MGRRIMLRIFILNLQVFLLIVLTSVYSSKIKRVEAGFQPSVSPTSTPSLVLTPSEPSISPTLDPITETPTTVPSPSYIPQVTPTTIIEAEPSKPPATTLTPTPPSATSIPEPTTTPTPGSQPVSNTIEPPMPPPPIENNSNKLSDNGPIKSVINKIVEPIKEIFREDAKKAEQPTPITYPEIESQWNTQETYYSSNRMSRKVSNLLLSLAGGLISGGFSLWFEPKLPFEYLNKWRKGNIYRAISRIFL